MPQLLPSKFYNRETEIVARELLGATLQVNDGHGIVAGRIVETEAYLGPHDPAAHSAVGRTERNWHLFGPPGTAYAYFIYGMYWCVNAVTREDGYGSAVLIRALEPVAGIERMRRRRVKAKRDIDLCNGPGKLCAALEIDRGINGAPLNSRVDARISIFKGEPVSDSEIDVGVRIGITKAADWPLRYWIRKNPFVSGFKSGKRR